MKLETIKTIRATINFKVDKSEIFKYPIQFDYFSREPYLEGSTIKGSLRYIMSESSGKVEHVGDIHMCSEKHVIYAMFLEGLKKKV